MHYTFIKQKCLIMAQNNNNPQNPALSKTAVISSAERDMWKMLDQINVIMWESYMIKDKQFGREEGRKIMEVLEQWAERH